MAWLKTLIVGMGILIVLGLGVIAVTIAKRGGKAIGGAGGPSGAFAPATLDVGPGCEILEARPDGGRLAVLVDGPGACRRIVVLDLATGAELGRVNVVPERRPAK